MAGWGVARSRLLLPLLLAAASLAGCAREARPAAAPTSRYVPVELPAGGLGRFVEGTLAARRGDADRATTLLESAVELDPGLITAHRLLGELYLDDGRTDDAERVFRRLVDLDADTARSHVLMGQALEALDQAEAALRAYLNGVEVDADDFEANLGAGRVLVGLDREAEALPHLSLATDVRPSSGEAWNLYADALDDTSDVAAADAAYARAIELATGADVDRAGLLLRAGTAAARAGDESLARDRLLQAATLDPAGPRPHRLLAALSVAAGERSRRAGEERAAAEAYQRALTHLEDAASRGGGAAVLATRGSVLIRLWQLGGELDPSLRGGAVDAWRRSLELDADQPAVRRALERYAD